MFFGLFGDDEDGKDEVKKADLRKVKATNDTALVGLQDLAARIGTQADIDVQDEAAQRRYLDRLRREGRGPE